MAYLIYDIMGKSLYVVFVMLIGWGMEQRQPLVQRGYKGRKSDKTYWIYLQGTLEK